jgi:hypothetical protein
MHGATPLEIRELISHGLFLTEKLLPNGLDPFSDDECPADHYEKEEQGVDYHLCLLLLL